MEIRKAEKTDFYTIMSWIKDEHECKNWAGSKVRFPLEIENLLIDVEYSKDNSYCLEDENTILAFGQLLPQNGEIIHMARIIVNPLCRGLGYGKIFCNSLLDIAEQLGYRKVSLNVYRNNTAPVKLYKKLGFKEIAEKSSSDRCYMVFTMN
ncbi:GCN5-related N-acetyltransferase [Melioribacter roseus P3M-2]|uniref:GCN5-related N-acetyltransferase n=1 Tax=Melioribacter roseus (strain DSM 23840 / JCM 17771 / VKM B-2668 / P3M-2) TaxID=1191523 RepID=I6Z5U7_MELRP|nr:GNAT family N-acetyltransferase [Melioribacter roseus]AFN74535.1 GCN5-related N-acetyltransferase [Melioribacter roseus P3M-2]